MKTTKTASNPLFSLLQTCRPDEKGMRKAMLTIIDPEKAEEVSQSAQAIQRYIDNLIGCMKCWILTNNRRKLSMMMNVILDIRQLQQERRAALSPEQYEFVERLRVLQWVIMEEEDPSKASWVDAKRNRFRKYFGHLGFLCMRIAYFGKVAFRVRYDNQPIV